VVHQLKDSNRTNLSWRDLKKRSFDKLVYIELWKGRLVKDKKISPSKVNVISDLSIYIDDSSINSAKSDVSFHYSNFSMKTRTASKLYFELLSLARKRSAPSETVIIAANQVIVFTPEAVKLLDILEEKLTFDEIVFFRALAEREIISQNTNGVAKSQYSGAIGWMGGLIQRSIVGVLGTDYIGLEAEQSSGLNMAYDPNNMFEIDEKAPYGQVQQNQVLFI
jgi:hypothetical protein